VREKMEKLIFIILAFSFIEVNAQTTRPANIEIPITVFDNSGLPNSSRILTCGIDSMATDSIDSFLGEYWLYCPFVINGNNSDCIPVDHFEAVLHLPNPPFLHEGTWKDFRYGEIPFSGTKTYLIRYLTYEAATALYISWNFPEGITGLLQNSYGGIVILNYQMPDSGTFTHPSFMQLNNVKLILTYQNIVPVELIAFSSSVIDNKVQLSWSTSTETNNSGFEILRFTQNDNNWKTIGFVEGFGTKTEAKSYSFIDSNVTGGIYKYKLKQMDFDGTFEYSNEIEVEVDFTPKEFVLNQNYPNPFNPNTTISWQSPVTSWQTLKIFDLLGNEVAVLVNEERPAGQYEVEFSPSGTLASGIYFYQLVSGDFSTAKKLMLLK
jgi:hypothetical protein